MENKTEQTVKTTDKNNKWWLTLLIVLARMTVGATFVFSGFVKAIDPMGTVYKFEDYFSAFGWEFLAPLALLFAVVLAAFEFLLGVNMFLGSYRKLTSWLILLVMSFMTPFTLYLAIKNPVSDCGCFGDALVITNWETFFKNIVLLLLSVFLFRFNERVRGIYNKPVQWVTVIFILAFVLSVTWVGYNRLPLLDFRPYKNGVNIPKEMVTAGKSHASEDNFVFIYEKDGIKKEFSIDDYPSDDSTWTFVDRVEKVSVENLEPKIKDFNISSPEGDMTTDILADTNYVFLMFSADINKADDSEIDRINDIYDYAQAHGYGFYCVTSSSMKDIKRWQDDTGAEYPFLYMDEIAIKTIIRANPGMLLLKDGTIYWKLSETELPDESDLTAPLNELVWGKQRTYNAELRIWYISLAFLVPMLLLLLTEKTVAAIIINLKNWRARRRARREAKKAFRKLESEDDSLRTGEQNDK